MRRRRTLASCLIPILVVVALFVLLCAIRAPYWAKVDGLHGKPMAEVVRVLGNPSGKMTKAEFEDRCRGFEQEGWIKSADYLPAHGPVWYYRSKAKWNDNCTMVYFDRKGKVERTRYAWW